MSQRHILYTLLAGLLAGIIFSAPAYGASGGLAFIYAPAFLLFLAGLSQGRRYTLIACVAACAVMTMLTDAKNAFSFALFLALPVWYFVAKALLWRDKDGVHEWYPVLGALCGVTLIACAMFMCLLMLGAGDMHELLRQIMANEVAESFHDAAPNVQKMMQWLTEDGRYMLFAVMGWSWVLLLYATAILATMALASRNLALRASLALTPHGLPVWLAGLLLISALLALGGQGGDAVAGKTVFLLLLLPYCLCGAAILHEFSRAWRGRVVWLWLFYIALAMSLWPAVFLIAMGIYAQMSEILDRARKMG